MNVGLLIDAIVRQTMVLIAELATSRGLRAPLAHLADQVFLELSRELEGQGLSQKVSADMFGLALRTYQRKVYRLREGAAERGQTLWEAVYAYVRTQPVVSRRQVLERFQHDEEPVVRGVLTDLVDSGLVFATGPSSDTTFRAASDEELGAMVGDERRSDELVWAIVFRMGPITAPALTAITRFDPQTLEGVLGRLIAGGRIQRDTSSAEPSYSTKRLEVPMGAASGWDAAVFDHYQAVVRMLVTKLRRGAVASAEDTTGASTYSMEIWDGHPLAEEVLGTLSRFRREVSALRERVRAHNQAADKPPVRRGVVVYGGQYDWEMNDEESDP